MEDTAAPPPCQRHRAARCQAGSHDSIPTGSLRSTHLGEVVVTLAASLQAQPAQELLLSSLHQLVEDVEVSLSVILMHDSGLLQQVVEDVASDSTPLWAHGPQHRARQHADPTQPLAHWTGPGLSSWDVG